MRMYALFDRKAGGYSQPQLAQNDAVMIRSLKDGLPEGSMPRQHPEDFDVYFLGAMDMETGVIASSRPELVAQLSAVFTTPVQVESPREVSVSGR